jgi:ectoine hydroxylase-related dioxygenase (phytanoyl-CoA dioxygenase family)
MNGHSIATCAALAGFEAAAHIERMRLDGYTIVEDFLVPEGLAAFREAIKPHLGRYRGRNPFEGQVTERVYTLVARGRVFEDITADPRVVALLDAFLRPGYLLSASHAIDIHPGEAAQSLHTDDSFYRVPRPRPAISVSVIGAIDPFTAENGATVAIPGSHLWSTDVLREKLSSPGLRRDAIALEMPAGAIAVFQGTLVHGAGANRSTAPRLAFTSQYCEPWARTQENFFLGVPRDRVARMSPPLQSLLGYSLMPPFMGQVTASHPLKSLEPGWLPPVVRQEREAGPVLKTRGRSAPTRGLRNQA